MQATYPQKLVLMLILGLFAAGAVKFYDVFVVGANDSVNGGVKARTEGLP